MNRILLLLVFIDLFLCRIVLGQNPLIKGHIEDIRTNDPLSGVTVAIKGTTIETITNSQGNYTIQASTGQSLVFTLSGYKTEEKNIGNSTIINLKMEPEELVPGELQVMGEFGMKRSARAVGSSIQTIDGNEIAESGQENFINSLQGRIAGMQVTNFGGLPGSSDFALLRGFTSISGNNQPLIVIDGIPMNNSTFNPVGGFAAKSGSDPVVTDRQLDFTNRSSDINPDDIERITVLKGMTAAALYGSDASNGAILICTKHGKIGKGSVQYNNYLRFDRACHFPEMQTRYDNGSYGTTNYYNSSRFGAAYPEGTVLSDNLKNLLQTGISQKHTISFETGNELLTLHASASTTRQKGIIPTSDYSRDNLSIAGTAHPLRWMEIEAGFQFGNISNTKISRGTGGVLQRSMIWPLTDDMRNYLAETGKIRYPNRYADVDILNPYFDLFKNRNFDETQRFISTVTVNLRPVKNLLIRGQVGFENSSTNITVVRHPQWASAASVSGTYDQAKVNENNPAINIIAFYSKSIGIFNASAQVGFHQAEQSSKTHSVHGEKFAVADIQSISNCDPTTLLNSSRTITRRLQAFSGSFELSYNNLAFIALRARNDWSSTLPAENNSYFYPAVDASLILSELPFLKSKSETIRYLKLRGSVAHIGRDIPPLTIYPVLEVSGTSYGGYRYGYSGPNPSLRPEMNSAWEAGVETSLFRFGLDLDITYYKTDSKDQIFYGFPLSYASGFVLNTMNAGSIRSDGVEAGIAGEIVHTDRWNLKTRVVLFKNWSEVMKLPPGLTEYYNNNTRNSGNIRNGVMIGYPVTSLTGIDYQKNTRGQVLIDPSTGLPLVSGTWSYLADREPKLNFGYTVAVKHKGFSLSALMDGKIKFAVVNGTKRYMMQMGYSRESVQQREAAPVVFNGVLKDGYENTDTPTNNTIGVRLGDLATGYSGQDPDWIEKNVNLVRLAELRLSYSPGKNWLMKNTGKVVSEASLFVLGSDLFIWTNYTGTDPVSNSNSPAQGGTGGLGQDIFAIAAPRGISLGINVTF